jgi:hypothetical protein
MPVCERFAGEYSPSWSRGIFLAKRTQFSVLESTVFEKALRISQPRGSDDLPARPSAYLGSALAFPRRQSRQNDLNRCANAGLAIKLDAAPQPIHNDVVNDMQPEATCSLMASRREEWIERAAPHIRRHAAAVVGKQNLDMVAPGAAQSD